MQFKTSPKDKMLRVDYGKFAQDAEKTAKDTLALIDTITADSGIGIAAGAVKAAALALLAAGSISVAGVLVLIGAVEALIKAMEADQAAQTEVLTVIGDLKVLKADLGL